MKWLVLPGSLEQNLRAKSNLMLLTVAFSAGQQELCRKRREERGVFINCPQQHSAPSIPSVPQTLPEQIHDAQVSMIADGYG